MTNSLKGLAWPVSQVHEALRSIGRIRSMGRCDAVIALPNERRLAESSAERSRWIEDVAHRFELEVVPVSSAQSHLNEFLARLGPGLLELEIEGSRVFLAVAESNEKHLKVIEPDSLRVRRLECRVVAEQVRAGHDQANLGTAVDNVLRNGIAKKRVDAVRRALLEQHVAHDMIAGAWILRLPSAAQPRRVLRWNHVVGRLVAFLVTSLTQNLLLVASWQVIGRSAFGMATGISGFWLWAFLIASMVIVSLYARWLAERLAVDLGGLLKQRLLSGATNLELDEMRSKGIGEFMAMAAETEAVESAAISGGFQVFSALLSVVVAVVVLYLGLGLPAALSLVVWGGITLVLLRRYYTERLRWTEQRRDLSNKLVERLIGHRTYLAQMDRERWKSTEDGRLASYLEASKTMDRTSVSLHAIATRGWPIFGGIWLLWALFHAPDPVALAIGAGGLLLAAGALQQLASGLSGLSAALISFREVRPLFDAARLRCGHASESLQLWAGGGRGGTSASAARLSAHEVRYTYPSRSKPVLEGCDLTVYSNDRILLEGESGSGKSTLGAALASLRTPQSGVLLLDGLDMQTLGQKAWRRRVVSVPQFHENHVFSSTLTFNILMGREWPPPSQDEVRRATSLCFELGLGPLLARMPASILQRVGETGWQLSHGERSRIFIARALIQDADVVILDESLAAMDPETFRLVLRCVLRRSSALILIAHP